MPLLSAEGRRIVEEVAARHGVGAATVEALLVALAEGGGNQAQFNIPELGGMGQWSRGGMVMVGDMFNNGLKAKVDALCNELAMHLGSAFAPAARAPSQSQSQSQGGGGGVSLFVSGGAGGDWWPAALGRPSSTGAQNAMRYAFFPDSRRLAISLGGKVTVYDTGDHRLGGFSQQQSGDQSLTFTSQHGLVQVADLPVIPDADADGDAATEPSGRPAEPAPEQPAPTPATQAPAAERPVSAPAALATEASGTDIIAQIERLAGLRDKGILDADEFAAKKRELLARL